MLNKLEKIFSDQSIFAFLVSVFNKKRIELSNLIVYIYKDTLKKIKTVKVTSSLVFYVKNE